MKPDVVAPGVAVRSAIRCERHVPTRAFSGTSMAGPHVVGVVALLWSARPDLVQEHRRDEAAADVDRQPGGRRRRHGLRRQHRRSQQPLRLGPRRRTRRVSRGPDPDGDESGDGTVTSTPAGISCPATCSPRSPPEPGDADGGRGRRLDLLRLGRRMLGDGHVHGHDEREPSVRRLAARRPGASSLTVKRNRRLCAGAKRLLGHVHGDDEATAPSRPISPKARCPSPRASCSRPARVTQAFSSAGRRLLRLGRRGASSRSGPRRAPAAPPAAR